MSQTPHNILIIKPGAIGDLLHISPALRALKKHLPDAQIDIMVGSLATKCLFEHNPHIRSVSHFDRKGDHRSLRAFFKLWHEVRSENYDLVINFQRSNFKVWLLVMAALPCRVLVYHKTRQRMVHAVVNHLETLAPLGIDVKEANLNLELFVSEDDKQFASKLISVAGLGGKPLIALNLGASNRIKCWAPQSFAQLGDRLATELDAGIILVGGPDELDLAELVMVSTMAKPLNLVGKMSLTQLGAMLQRSKLLVSGDTGPLHLATAVGTKVIGLFGAIDPMRTGPVGSGHIVISHPEVPCVPCNDKKCHQTPYLECMTRITVDEVAIIAKNIVLEER
ncbi:MAG: glycosyltransferase family 9 protein [Desulfuromonadaceae bacterium]|nr:glycosyltransferase family 9 protein [Desulfuromonadaceae bacterium]